MIHRPAVADMLGKTEKEPIGQVKKRCILYPVLDVAPEKQFIYKYKGQASLDLPFKVSVIPIEVNKDLITCNLRISPRVLGLVADTEIRLLIIGECIITNDLNTSA